MQNIDACQNNRQYSPGGSWSDSNSDRPEGLEGRSRLFQKGLMPDTNRVAIVADKCTETSRDRFESGSFNNGSNLLVLTKKNIADSVAGSSNITTQYARQEEIVAFFATLIAGEAAEHVKTAAIRLKKILWTLLESASLDLPAPSISDNPDGMACTWRFPPHRVEIVVESEDAYCIVKNMSSGEMLIRTISEDNRVPGRLVRRLQKMK